MAKRLSWWFVFFSLISGCCSSQSHSKPLWKVVEDKFGVDPDDRVNVEQWNRWNEEDTKRMPQTEDYSNENDAIEWLEWYSRISERYHQVRIDI